MELKNNENGVALRFNSGEGRRAGSFFSQNTLNPDSKIRILKQCPDIEIQEYALLRDLTNPDFVSG